MFKFISFILCVVAIRLINAYAVDDETHQNVYLPLGVCLEQYGLTGDDLDVVKSAADVSKINPGFYDCYFTKLGFINDQGQYDLNTGMANMKRILKRPNAYVKLEEAIKQCVIPDVKGADAGGVIGMALAACLYDVKVF